MFDGLFLGLNIQLMAEALPLLLLVAVAAWLLSLVAEDVSVVDYVWSLMSMLTASTYAYSGFYNSGSLGSGSSTAGSTNIVGVVLLAMVVIWALRLSGFLILRSRNQPEDRRYRAIREKFSPHFELKSLAVIFLFQAFLAWIISSLFAVEYSVDTEISWGYLHSIGVFLWLLGMAFETVADIQLYRFNKLVVRETQTLTTGLWRYSRHPNYFGECCIWWGWAIFVLPCAIETQMSVLWVFVAPVVMTLLLLKVSGVANMERGIVERRPDYRDYIEATNAFFPWKPARKVSGDRQ